MKIDDRQLTHNRPTWFLNMLAGYAQVYASDPTEYLYTLIAWAPSINMFLDGTMVKANPNAQAVVDVCYRIFLRYADFMYLVIVDSDSDEFKLLRSTFRRLDGLTLLENHKARDEARKKREASSK